MSIMDKYRQSTGSRRVPILISCKASLNHGRVEHEGRASPGLSNFGFGLKTGPFWPELWLSYMHWNWCFQNWFPALITTFESSGQVLSYQRALVKLVNAVSLVGTNRAFGLFVNRMEWDGMPMVWKLRQGYVACRKYGAKFQTTLLSDKQRLPTW